MMTGGQHIPERSLRRAAQASGISGGFISSLSPTDAQGLYGSWNEPLVLYQQEHIGAGHIASVMYFDRGALEPNYLYRIPVAGRPDLNTMSTPLNMQLNDIHRVNELDAVNLETSQDIAAGNDIKASGIVQADGDIIAGKYLRLAYQGHFAGQSCSQGQGAVTVDGEGALLACKSGLWKGMEPGNYNPNSPGWWEVGNGLIFQWGIGRGIVTMPRNCPNRILSVNSMPAEWHGDWENNRAEILNRNQIMLLHNKQWIGPFQHWNVICY